MNWLRNIMGISVARSGYTRRDPVSHPGGQWARISRATSGGREWIPNSHRPAFLCSLILSTLFAGSGTASAQSGHSLAPEHTTALEPSLQQYADGLTKWSPEVSLAVRYIRSYPGNSAWPIGGKSSPVVVSPNGDRFFFLVDRSELACDCKVAELYVFETAAVRESLASAVQAQPLRTLIRQSRDRGVEAIGVARWERDGSSISFVGLSENGQTQLYEINVVSGEIRPLTDSPNGVGIFPDHVGDTIVSSVRVPSKTAPQKPVYPVHSITKTEMLDAMLPLPGYRLVTYISFRGGREWTPETTNIYTGGSVAFSPDGRKAIMVRAPKELPRPWGTYGLIRQMAPLGDLAKAVVPRFMYLDAEQGTMEPLFDAPAGIATRVGAERVRYIGMNAYWAEDGRHVIVTNTALPLMGKPESARKDAAYIVSFDTATLNWAIIEPLEESVGSSGATRYVKRAGWLKPGKEFLIEHEMAGKPAAGAVYSLEGNRWIKGTVAAEIRIPKSTLSPQPALEDGLSVALSESANEPPTIFASDGRRRLALTDKDPAIQNVWWARTEDFEWRDPGGELNRGGLLLPRDFDSSRKVPLVVQAYYYFPQYFRPDGPFPNAYAAQSLVAQGMAVLNIDIPIEVAKTPRELTKFAQRVSSAADALAERGFIDRKRVGLVGFSRAGFLGYYAITHPDKIPLAAAVIDDSWSGTFADYLMYMSPGVSEGEALGNYEALLGGSFWQNKETWLEHENSFNVDKVKTPSLFTKHSQSEVLTTFPEVAAFGRNRRPLEYLMFPEGEHQLVRPAERVASMQATIDWMSFWLKDAPPADQERAEKWNRLKHDWERQIAWESAGNPVGSMPR